MNNAQHFLDTLKKFNRDLAVLLEKAKQLNRNAIGIEISPTYCELIQQRLDEQVKE